MNDDDTTKLNNDDSGDESVMNENNEMTENVDTQEESMEETTSTDEVPSDWIKVTNGKFVCGECENESEPETNTVDGTVKADTEKIKSDLKAFPSKIIYGSCPVCGMEYTFKEKNGELYMEPSDMIK